MKHYDFTNAAVVLAGTNAAREFLEPIFFERDQELTIVAFCDGHLRLVQLLSFAGCRDSTQISVPDVVRHALGCAGLIIAHNHPSGNPQPSNADLRLTRRLCLVAEAVDVELLDHLIFTRGGVISFRQSGLM